MQRLGGTVEEADAAGRCVPDPLHMATPSIVHTHSPRGWHHITSLPAYHPLQGWAVPDGALRNRVRDELVTTLAPLYDAFCAKYVAAPYTGGCRVMRVWGGHRDLGCAGRQADCWGIHSCRVPALVPP